MPALPLSADAKALLTRAASLSKTPVWLVGGALRDAGLGKPVVDLDLACKGARALASAFARELKGSFVVLDEESGVFRVALKDGRQVDVAEIQGGSIEKDLLRRDFACNAMALALNGAFDDLLDPRGGLSDLKKKVLRCEEERLFKEDPLRLLRAYRIAAQNGLTIEAKTSAMISRQRRLISKPAGERVQAELMLLLAAPGASKRLAEMDGTGLLTALLPELEPGRKCAEDYYGKGGVLRHTLDVCARLELLLDERAKVYPELAGALERWACGPDRAALLIAALLHDVAKPETAKMTGGRLRFFEHDTIGAVRAEDILERLRFSSERVRLCSAVVRHHLRPGHLAAAGGASEKAVYRFFRDLGEHAIPLLLVCWADHASYLDEPRLRKLLPGACGEGPSPKVSGDDAKKTVAHLRLVSMLLRRGFDAARAPVPVRLLDGKQVMKALKIPPGPKVGEALERLREAQAEGKVRDKAQALQFVSRLKLRS